MPLCARSVEEEHLYLELHPCACGAPIDPTKLAHELFLDGDDDVSVFHGRCELYWLTAALRLESPSRFWRDALHARLGAHRGAKT